MAGPRASIPEPRWFKSLRKGRCTVVSGGSGGAGKAIVRRHAEAGAGVVMTGRGRPASERLP